MGVRNNGTNAVGEANPGRVGKGVGCLAEIRLQPVRDKMNKLTIKATRISFIFSLLMVGKISTYFILSRAWIELSEIENYFRKEKVGPLSRASLFAVQRQASLSQSQIVGTNQEKIPADDHGCGLWPNSARRSSSRREVASPESVYPTWNSNTPAGGRAGLR